MSQKFVQTQALALYSGMSSAATTAIVTPYPRDIQTNTKLVFADFGTTPSFTVDPKIPNYEEICTFTGITDNGDDTATLTGLVRNLIGQSPYTTPGTGKQHGASAVVVFSDNPQVYARLGSLENDQPWTGINTFIQSPIVPTATTATQAINKAQLDSTAFSGASDSSTTVKGVTRISVSPDGTPTALTSISNASPAVFTLTSHGLTLNDSIVLTTSGTLPTGLSLATTYYVISAGLTANAFEVSATLGGTAINTSSAGSGTHSFTLTTPVAVGTKDYRVGSNNYAVDAGVDDTYVITLSNAPSAYATGQEYTFKANTANTGTATLNINGLGAKTIVRSDGSTLLTGDIIVNQQVTVKYDGTNLVMISAPANTVNLAGGIYPAGNGANITGLSSAISKASYTASGDIAINDTVYVSAASTVKKLYPSAQGTGAAITTSPTTTTGSHKMFPLSTNGYTLRFNGGSRGTAGILYAQVCILNAGETDLTYGAEQTVYSTGIGTMNYRVCQINTDKFAIIFQANTASAAAGIKCVVVSVSGTTVTVGAVQTIEGAGALSTEVGIAKVDTDKCAIFYAKDSDSDLYCQILTVSGTTISTNSPVLVKAGSVNWHVDAIQLTTGTVMVVYQGSTTGILYGSVITVSGTTPSIGAEQTVINTSANYIVKITFISTTKVLLVYSESTTVTNDQCALLTISGATITKGSNLALSSANSTYDFGVSIIGINYALVCDYSSNTSMNLYLLDITGAAPISISSQALTTADTSGLHNSTMACKIAPWTYLCGGFVSNADYIVKLTPVSTARIGMAEAAISSAASGNILFRYLLQTITASLTAGSIYYVDDDAQPTTKSSLTSPILGIAIDATKILIQ